MRRFPVFRHDMTTMRFEFRFKKLRDWQFHSFCRGLCSAEFHFARGRIDNRKFAGFPVPKQVFICIFFSHDDLSV